MTARRLVLEDPFSGPELDGFPDTSDRDPRRYPKWGDVRAVRAYTT